MATKTHTNSNNTQSNNAKQHPLTAHAATGRKYMRIIGILLLLSVSWGMAQQVTNNNDTGAGSLRAAIANAASGDIITFDGSLSGATITLTSGELNVNLADLTIDASDLANPVTIDANNNSRVFTHTGTGTFEINNLVVTNGNSGGSGGGIISLSAVTVTNSTISGNSASDSGGGISSLGAVTVTNSTILGNSVDFDGGGIRSSSNVTVTNSTISSNSSGRGGSGIWSLVAVTVNNTTIAGNSADDRGGGIFSSFGTVTVNNSTISGNSANNGSGGGIWGTGAATLNNSLVLGNTAPTNPQVSAGGGLTLNNSAYGFAAGESTGDSFVGFTITDVFTNPVAAASAPTTAGDYTLVACSPAINAGDNTLAPAGDDLAGNTRIQQTVVDMGAFESALQTCQSITFDLSTLPAKTLGDADFDISGFATASSGLAVTFDSAAPAVCTVTASTVTLVAAGTCTIDADQAGNAVYQAALQVQQSFNVNAPATTIVNKTDDTNDGSCDTADCSLREAIANAADGDIITFDGSLSGATITLALGELSVNLADLTIDASALTNPVTIDANNNSRVFNHTGTGTFEINNLVVTNGITTVGGGIFSESNVTVTNSTISGNSADAGGGINSRGNVTVTNSTFSGNSANGGGGGIVSFGNVTVTNSTFSGNLAISNFGGGITSTGNVTITNSTFSGNAANNFGGGGMFSAGTVTLNNSLVLGNTAPNNPQIRADGGLTLNNSAYGFAAGESTGDRFVGFALADVFTAPEPAASAPTNAGDYTLAACSPAINAGNNTLAPTGNDLAGNARIQVVTVDMGAYESNLQACQTIDFDLTGLPAKTYGDVDFDISGLATASSGLAVTFDSAAPAVCTVTGSTVTLVAAGTCIINADQAGNAEFDPAPQVQQSFDIAQKALTAVVNNATRDYGAANPVFTLTYDGLVAGDAAADIDVAPMLTTTAVATSNVGDYDITCNVVSFADNNYTLSSCAAGTLTVSPIVVTVNANDVTISEGSTPTYTAVYQGFVNGEDASVLDTPVTFVDDAPDYDTVGIYTITPSGGAATNYTFSYEKGTLTVQSPGFGVIDVPNGLPAIPEGTTYGLEVFLTFAPSDSVSIVATPDNQVDVGNGAGNPFTITFTPDNWNIPQTLNITAVDDLLIEGEHEGRLTFTTTSVDTRYNGLVIADIVVTITDNEPVLAFPTDLAIIEGSTITYDIGLTANPAIPISIIATPDAQVDLGAGAGVAVTFIFNDASPQTVTMTAVDDADVEGDHTSIIQYAVQILGNTLVAGDVTVSITDNDVVDTGSGSVINPDPDMQIRNGATITAAVITSNALEPLRYGTYQRGEVVTLNFLIRNSGRQPLDIGALTLPNFFTQVGTLPATLASFESALLTVEVDTSAAGTFTGQVSLASNDPDVNENPFVFDVVVTVSDTPANAINVLPGVNLGVGNISAGQQDVVLLSFKVEVPAGSVPVDLEGIVLSTDSVPSVEQASNLKLYIDGGTRGALDNNDVFVAELAGSDLSTLTFTFPTRTFSPNLPMWFIVVGDF
jgi:CSLREA domain-containing protein